MRKQFDEAVEGVGSGGLAEEARRGIRARLRRPLMVGLPLLLAIGGGARYLHGARDIATDDAFVRAAKVSINARVPGQVVKVAVTENQQVHAGQLLFQIDPEPYRIAVEQAEARLGGARLQVEALKATYRRQLADVESARLSADFDSHEYERKKALLASDFASYSAYEQAQTDLMVARQRIASAQQDVSNSIAGLNGDPNIEVDRHPTVREARAQLDRARLDLSYTRIVAPGDGVVTKVDDLQAGDFVSSGATVFSMMSSRRIWVEANFRETGLTHMRPGQAAIVDVDTYPGHGFKAHVISISPGTGSEFALLPPENATGNWVKVVQRLPVRLELDEVDPKWPLYSGMSVTAQVDTRRHGFAASPATGAGR